jgi:hypothetical protein
MSEKFVGRPPASLEEAERILFKVHGDSIILLEYNGMNYPGKFECKICGHKWEVKRADRVIKTTNCPNCAKMKDKYTLEYVKEYIESQGCKLLSDIYVNAKTMMTIQFECGHINQGNWNEFQQGKRCILCGVKARSNAHRTKEKDIIKFLEDNGFEFIDFPTGFKTQKTSSVRYKCKYGHITTREVDRIYVYTTCKTCEFADLAILKKGEQNTNWKGGTSELRWFAQNQIRFWKLKSAKNCNYKCVISGETFDDIHHLYSFNLIMDDAIRNLNLPVYDKMEKYTVEEYTAFANEIIRLHNIHPLGVCLTESLHMLFHSLYGYGYNTPDQWSDFVYRINVGEIDIRKEALFDSNYIT